MNTQPAPALRPGRFHWQGEAPDPIAIPALFDGARWRRIVAYLIDVVIVLLLAGLLWLAGSVFIVLTLGALTPLVVIGAALLPIAYHTFFIGGPRNATLGMQMMDLRVVAWNGNRPTYLQAGIQTVLFYLTVPTTNGLILLVSLFNDRGRCVHEMLCGTLTINDLMLPEIEGPDGR